MVGKSIAKSSAVPKARVYGPDGGSFVTCDSCGESALATNYYHGLHKCPKGGPSKDFLSKFRVIEPTTSEPKKVQGKSKSDTASSKASNSVKDADEDEASTSNTKKAESKKSIDDSNPKEESKTTKKQKLDESKAKVTKSHKDAAEGSTESKHKRPQNAYMIFSQACRASVMAENPEMKITEVSKILGAKWRAMTDEEKAEWQEKAAEQKGQAATEPSGEAGKAKGKKDAAKDKVDTAAAKKRAAAAEAKEKKLRDEEDQDSAKEEEDGSGASENKRRAGRITRGRANKEADDSKSEAAPTKGADEKDTEQRQIRSQSSKQDKIPDEAEAADEEVEDCAETGYGLWSADMRRELMEKQPELKPKEIFAELTRRWEALPADERASFDRRAAPIAAAPEPAHPKPKPVGEATDDEAAKENEGVTAKKEQKGKAVGRNGRANRRRTVHSDSDEEQSKKEAEDEPKSQARCEGGKPTVTKAEAAGEEEEDEVVPATQGEEDAQD